MTTEIKRRRGTTAEHAAFTGALGEITIDTTKKTAVVHDGATVSGVPLAREDLANSAAPILFSGRQTPVISAALTAPPGAPEAGDRYIIAAAPTGAWAGRATQIAEYRNGAWAYVTPVEGWRVWNQATDTVLHFDGAANWAAFHSLPAGGAAGHVLRKVSNTDQNVAWQAPPNATPTVQVFTASGNYAQPAGKHWARVRVWGAGGGGQGAVENWGGGGGGYVEKFIAIPPGTVVAITVGAGGGGGGAGGNSAFAGQCAASGGAPGTTSSALGGTGSGGDINLQGGSSGKGASGVIVGAGGAPPFSPDGLSGLGAQVAAVRRAQGGASSGASSGGAGLVIVEAY